MKPDKPLESNLINAKSVKINSLDSQLNCTHILHGASRQYYAKWEGHLSLKSFSHGQAFYNAGAGHYAVDESSFLILNELQPYAMVIDSEKAVESFVVFFETDFAEEVYRSLTAKNSQLLDDPEKAFSERINFVQKLYSRRFVEDILTELRMSVQQSNEDQVWLKEKLHALMQRILWVRNDSLMEIEQVSAARASTRNELYRRIYRARDFIAASYNQPLLLEEMAKVACLSPNHFLRSFKQIFCRTPHQYLTNLRLKEAQKLLELTNLPIIQICQSVGFESHASFSSLFRRYFGLSPEKYRRKKR